MKCLIVYYLSVFRKEKGYKFILRVATLCHIKSNFGKQLNFFLFV